jgi:lipid-A-disaccharide synthase
MQKQGKLFCRVNNIVMNIAISVAETSGDILASKLITVIKKHYPKAKISGLIGEKSIHAGAKQLWDMNRVNVMGFTEVIKKLIPIWLLRKKMLAFWNKNPPDIFIGVDSPDFNLTIEAKLKKKNVKTIHFISPSVWAWREKKVEKIKKVIDIVLCLLSFEVGFYNKHNINAHFVGHPLVNITPRVEYQKHKHIALLPGSRRSEIEAILPTMIKTANNILRIDNEYKFHIALADDSNLDLVKHWVKGDKITYSIDDTYDVVAHADLAVVASGTASLEVALIGTPQVVVYKLNNISYQLVKRKLTTKFVSLPNIILNKRVILELLQDEYNQSGLANAMFQTLKNATLQREHFAKLQPLLTADFDAEVGRSIHKLLSA